MNRSFLGPHFELVVLGLRVVQLGLEFIDLSLEFRPWLLQSLAKKSFLLLFSGRLDDGSYLGSLYFLLLDGLVSVSLLEASKEGFAFLDVLFHGRLVSHCAGHDLARASHFLRSAEK
jgi:hypothetical protein